MLSSIDWKWWLTEIPVRVDWWSGAEHYWYVHVCRLNITLLSIAGALVAAIFFLAALKRSGLEFILRDNGD